MMARRPATARWMVSAAMATSMMTNAAMGQDPIRTLLITGENNHNWRYTSRYHKDTLEATGRFSVDITDSPAQTLADAGKAGYQLFVIDYNGNKRWGEPAEAGFLKAVEGGAGVVIIHAANNAFGWPRPKSASDDQPWVEYEKMVGPMWREGAGHGKFHHFDVKIVDREHPITKGLPDLAKHPDELYHKLTNLHNTPYTLLAQARSSTESGGTGKDEPMAMTLAYGKGRVFHTPLGHVWEGSEEQKASIADPQFKVLLTRGAEWAATGAVTLGASWEERSAHNTLTDAEKKGGWKLLFDGTAAQFRGFKKDKLPDGWKAAGGMLMLIPGAGGGDIVTLDQYQDFEFACDWKVGPKGNSGIMYRCTEDKTYPWETGPEMQILDNAGHQDGKKKQTSAGALYDLLPCQYDVIRPAGEWNHALIRVKGTRIEHWMNGFKVVECDTAGEDYRKAHAASKWVKMPDFNTRAKGHIALQDHGDEVFFRNIKVRELK